MPDVRGQSESAGPRMLSQSRLILWAGFGGLLLLMSFTSIDTLQELAAIHNRTETVQRDFIQRDRLLHEIRADLYLSGTYVRDYLLEPEPANAEKHRDNLNGVRSKMDQALTSYARLVNASTSVPFIDLNHKLADYWKLLDPVFGWSSSERHERGYNFLQNDLFPRRAQMLAIADQVAAVNENQLNSRNARVAELYSQLRTRMILTSLLALALGCVLAIFSARRILFLEHAADQRFREIETARGELKELSARLVRAQEEERRAISRELHDEVGQTLTALLVGLGNLAAVAPLQVREYVSANVEPLRKLAESSVAAVRNMALLLRPSMLDDLGLIPALQWQARETARRTGLNVVVTADGVPDDLPEEPATCIYRVAQEALHNISRHAVATKVSIRVAMEGSVLKLNIHDDGRGFNPTQERGLGLLGMQERVTNLAGTFKLVSQPGSGTTITVELHVPQPVGVS